MEWRERDGARWLEADLSGARAAFTTRTGGVSEAPYDSLNLGLLTDDAEDAVAENRRRLAAALGFGPEQIAFARQVHGTRLLTHPPRGSFRTHCAHKEPRARQVAEKSEVPEADGHVIADAGTAVLVFAADCLPVALYGPGGVAMLHCGWRGLAAGIIAAGAEAVGAMNAAIGPGIGPCCYEVGDEVLAAFGVRDESRRLDLVAVTRRRLAEAGVERVESAGLCTSCEPELFFSHRRDAGRTGRQAGLAWISEEA
jgi:purine-nucleoside/S-methyl-5'-thioadenosine phosphorylase / adenosine deaminase